MANSFTDAGRRRPEPAKGKHSFFWANISKTRQVRLFGAMPLLEEALSDSQNAEKEPWQFAITSTELVTSGLRLTDLRWLVSGGLLAHATERNSRSGNNRKFGWVTPLAVGSKSCFILSAKGIDFLRSIPREQLLDAIPIPLIGIHPNWNSELRELTLCGLLVKRFRTPAARQELILTVFEEEGWPGRIDDPLPSARERLLSGRDRLHEVVKSLNRNQKKGRIRFSRDGHGQGVCWCSES